jgi:LPS-assembly lipoprotein
VSLDRSPPATAASREAARTARRWTRRGGSVLLLAALLVLTGCGFALRGEAQLPPELAQMRLDMADVGPPIRRELAASLERAGVELMPADATGVAVMRVPVNAAFTEALTISEQARVREYAVRHRVVFELRSADGSVLMPEQEILLERDFVFDERDALGVAGQEEALRQDMEREMVRAILRRIESLERAGSGG